VPERLARPGHAGGERQQVQIRHPFGIGGEHLFVAAHVHVEIRIVGRRQAERRVNQDGRVELARRTQCQLALRAVHRARGMKGDDARPSTCGEVGAQFGGRAAPPPEHVMRRQLQHLQATADAERVRAAHERCHAGILAVRHAVHGVRLGIDVSLPDVLDRQGSERDAFRIAQREDVSTADFRSGVVGHVEGDRHRPQSAVGEPHPRAHRVVVASRHEAVERRARARGQQLEIAELPPGQIPGWPVTRLGTEYGGAGGCDAKVDGAQDGWSTCRTGSQHVVTSIARGQISSGAGICLHEMVTPLVIMRRVAILPRRTGRAI
jgi:hypothetical protein